MSLASMIRDHVNAAFPALWVRSIEHDDAEREIRAAARAENWTVSTWDLDRGLARTDSPAVALPDPLEAIHQLRELRDPEGRPAILIARNLHPFIKAPDVIQAIDTAISEGKTARTYLIVLAPVAELPPELDRQIIVLDHELPTRDDLERIARQIGTEEELPTGTELEQLRDASAGLTRFEAEGAYSLSLARRGRIEPETVWTHKAAAIAKSGTLSVYRGAERFADLGGLGALKDFTKRALRPDRPAQARPRGVLLLGVPGTGKSAFAKALGNETGRPTLTLDMGSMFGSLVGQTEECIRRALAVADAMSPAVLFVDEIEKALAGSGGSGSNDSGVTSRLFGTLLTWLNDHTSDVFFIATSNNISALPPEFSRAERFDGIFFIDFPTPAERSQIWDLHIARHALDTAQERPRDTDWTGAEIASCCRLAALLGITLKEAAANVVPISATAGENIAALRRWSDGRCLDSSRPGLYQSRQPAAPTVATAEATQARRSIKRPAAGTAFEN